jgi:hypothetical protein
MSSPAKARAAKANAKLGGWPKGKKRGKRKRATRRPNAKLSSERAAEQQKQTGADARRLLK